MEKKSAKPWQVALCALFLVLAVCLPDIGMITSSGFLVLGCFLALLLGWMFNVSAVFSIIVLIVYSIATSQSFTTSVIGSVFSSANIWMLIFAFWFSMCMRESGLMSYISTKMLGMKIASKGPFWLMATIIVTTIITAAIVPSALAIMFIMMDLIRDISNKMEMEPYNKWVLVTGVSVCLTSAFASVMFPFHPLRISYMALLSSSLSVTSLPNDIAYTAHYAVTLALVTVVMVAIAKFIFRAKIDMSKFSELGLSEKAKEAKLTKSMKYAIVAIIVLIAIVMLPNVLPSGFFLTTWLGYIGSTGAFGIVLIIMNLCIRKETGKPVFEFDARAATAINWTTILYLAPMFYIGDSLMDSSNGITTFLQWVTSPLTSLSPIALICVLCLLLTITTNVGSNFALALLFGTIGYAALGTDNVYSAMFMTMLMLNLGNAVAAPASGTPGLVLNSNKDLFKAKDLFTWGYLLTIVVWAVSCAALLITQGLY